jgi:hypothetical protein
MPETSLLPVVPVITNEQMNLGGVPVLLRNLVPTRAPPCPFRNFHVLHLACLVTPQLQQELGDVDVPNRVEFGRLVVENLRFNVWR